MRQGRGAVRPQRTRLDDELDSALFRRDGLAELRLGVAGATMEGEVGHSKQCHGHKHRAEGAGSVTSHVRAASPFSRVGNALASV